MKNSSIKISYLSFRHIIANAVRSFTPFRQSLCQPCQILTSWTKQDSTSQQPTFSLNRHHDCFPYVCDVVASLYWIYHRSDISGINHFARKFYLTGSNFLPHCIRQSCWRKKKTTQDFKSNLILLVTFYSISYKCNSVTPMQVGCSLWQL